MKKFVTSILAAALLLSMFAVQILAADDTVTLSIKGAEGKPGDVVEVQVYMDENPGLWSCGFDIGYNASYFQLGDVENGDVFSDSAFVKSVIAPTGSYRYYAQYTNYKDSTSETGLLATFRFKILEAAPNGNHNISLNMIGKGNGKGWIIKPGSDAEPMDITINAGGPATVKVTGSDATGPIKDNNTTNPSDTGDKSEETTGRPVTEYVTDSDHYVVRDEDGTPVTQVVTYAVTNENGDPVYDDDGNPVTEIKTEAVTETEKPDSDDSNDTEKNVGMKKIILIAGIVLLVVAAAIIIVILYNARKNGNGPKGGSDGPKHTGDADNADNADNKDEANDSDKQE